MDILDAWVAKKQMCEKYEWPTLPSLNYYIYSKPEFSHAFMRVGRRVFVNPKRFFDIVGKHSKRDDFCIDDWLDDD